MEIKKLSIKRDKRGFIDKNRILNKHEKKIVSKVVIRIFINIKESIDHKECTACVNIRPLLIGQFNKLTKNINQNDAIDIGKP